MDMPVLPSLPTSIASTDLRTLVDHAKSVDVALTLNEVHDAFGSSGPSTSVS